MKNLQIKGYEAYTNSDLTEGRGHHVLIGYFTNEEDAKKAIKGEGVMGTDASVRDINKTISIFENYEEYLQQKDAKILESIKNKLSKDELRVLGICK